MGTGQAPEHVTGDASTEINRVYSAPEEHVSTAEQPEEDLWARIRGQMSLHTIEHKAVIDARS
jgi:hypothetical protein